jgi:FAD/FMN-containing dehydrogenase
MCQRLSIVVAAVNFAREQALPVSVYGGGHGVTGSAVVDAGVCIDMRGLTRIAVDPGARTAEVAGGCTWGEVDAATQEHGLAVTGGRVPTTGVAGLALGSGSGWIERKFGFTCDNLVEAEVVTADGRVVLASDAENPDLF